FAFGCAVVSPSPPKWRNRGKRQPGAGSMSLVGLSSMSVSHADRRWVTIEDAGLSPFCESCDGAEQAIEALAPPTLFVAGPKGDGASPHFRNGDRHRVFRRRIAGLALHNHRMGQFRWTGLQEAQSVLA